MSITYTLSFTAGPPSQPLTSPPLLSVDEGGNATYRDGSVTKQVQDLLILYTEGTPTPATISVSGGARIEVLNMDVDTEGSLPEAGGCSWTVSDELLELTFSPAEPSAGDASQTWTFSADTPALKLTVRVKRQANTKG